MATEQEIRELKRKHAPDLLGRPGVSGVGVEKDADGGFVLAVHLNTDDPEALGGLPASRKPGWKMREPMARRFSSAMTWLLLRM